MINSGKRFNIDKYLHEYAEFIIEYKIKDYVELDVDQIYGVHETRKLRDKLEKLVGYQSIPVWHTIRREQSFLDDCRDYNRICLGFFLTEGIASSITERYATHFINRAHRLGCKIHGLGFTKTKLLRRMPFDSVDSSTWTSGKRYGQLNTFDPNEGIMIIKSRPSGYKANPALIERYNYDQWRAYQDYARYNIHTI